MTCPEQPLVANDASSLDTGSMLDWNNRKPIRHIWYMLSLSGDVSTIHNRKRLSKCKVHSKDGSSDIWTICLGAINAVELNILGQHGQTGYFEHSLLLQLKIGALNLHQDVRGDDGKESLTLAGVNGCSDCP